MNLSTSSVLASLTALSFASAAWALPNVAIVAAADTAITGARFTDVQSKLMGTGQFASVGIINAGAVTPTLAELQAFDAVMCWSNFDFDDEVALGNVLADYVDAGGGVVVTVFAVSTTGTARVIGGRFDDQNYDIIPVRGGGTVGGSPGLGTVLVPTHPVMNGVTTFLGGSTSSRPTLTTLADHGIKVAEWTDGKTLIAASSLHPNRIDLGFYPPSRDVADNLWDPATDGARIMANALTATIGTQPDCPADLDGGLGNGQPDGAVTIDDLLYFLAGFEAGSVSVDLDNGTGTGTPDGAVTVDDLLFFLVRFEAGC